MTAHHDPELVHRLEHRSHAPELLLKLLRLALLLLQSLHETIDASLERDLHLGDLVVRPVVPRPQLVDLLR